MDETLDDILAEMAARRRTAAGKLLAALLDGQHTVVNRDGVVAVEWEPGAVRFAAEGLEVRRDLPPIPTAEELDAQAENIRAEGHDGAYDADADGVSAAARERWPGYTLEGRLWLNWAQEALGGYPRVDAVTGQVAE